MSCKKELTIQEKIIDCLDNKIKNLHPSLREKLILELQDFSDSNDIVKIKKFITKKLNLPTNGRNTQHYWISRGWSEIEAYYFMKEFNRTKPKQVSVYSREFWVTKINPNTGKKYTIQEADFERNSRRPIKKEYWIKKGYSELESAQLAEKTKYDNLAKSQTTKKDIKRKAYNRLTKEYWLLRGYSEEEYNKIISEKQKTFSLELCIEKYGEEKGKKIWKNRQDKWQKTLKNKPLEEIKEINKKKNPFRMENYNSVDQLIDAAKKSNITTLVKTEEELLENILKDLKANVCKTLWRPEKYVNSILKTQLKILNLKQEDLLEKIRHLFNNEPFLTNNGAYSSYILWVKEGLLRSSFEIYFYNEIKNINENAIIGIDKNYPNSRMRYDFKLDNGDIIELCPLFAPKNENRSETSIKYFKKMERKIKLFNPIIIKNEDELNSYIERYKNDFITRSK